MASPGTAGPSATEAFGRAWALAKRDFASVILPLAVGYLLTFAINIGMNLALVPVKIALGVATGVKAGVATGVATGVTTGLGIAALLDAAVAIPATVVAGFFAAGFFRFSSRLVRGQKPAFGDVFSGASYLVPALIASFATLGIPLMVMPLLRLLPFVGHAAGFLLVMAGGMAWPWAIAVAVDRGMGGAELVTAGWAEATRALGTSLLLMLFGGLGVLACCLGMFVTLPLMWIAIAYVYHSRKGDAAALAPA